MLRWGFKKNKNKKFKKGENGAALTPVKTSSCSYVPLDYSRNWRVSTLKCRRKSNVTWERWSFESSWKVLRGSGDPRVKTCTHPICNASQPVDKWEVRSRLRAARAVLKPLLGALNMEEDWTKKKQETMDTSAGKLSENPMTRICYCAWLRVLYVPETEGVTERKESRRWSMAHTSIRSVCTLKAISGKGSVSHWPALPHPRLQNFLIKLTRTHVTQIFGPRSYGL